MTSPLTLTTPLGSDALFVAGFTGTEGISRPFSFDLDLRALNSAPIPFERVLGQPMTLAMTKPGGGTRFFSGFCSRFSAGGRDARYTSYRAELVPSLWVLLRRRNSRIFQGQTVIQILARVFTSLPEGSFRFRQEGSYVPREYCVQYRESDFDFASRLMEEEGIFYFFEHSGAGHQLIMSDSQSAFAVVGAPAGVTFAPTAPTTPDSSTVFDWEKSQEVRSGRVTLWDNDFTLPGDHLEGDAVTQDAVRVGAVTHHLRVGGNSSFELYDYPGGYAKRFNGAGAAGSQEHAAAAQAARIRMQEEAAQAIAVDGLSDCRQFTAGHTFSLKGHPFGNGKYVLTRVTHSAKVTGDPRSATQAKFAYHNSFDCIPVGLPFRPVRTTPSPVIPGTQTAVVVGPAGEQIHTDQFGRIKVQFHWDRQGRNDENSSTWVRVGALHAGQEGGFTVVPRIGQEVVVNFLEGDPDQPIVTGSVYDPNHPPPPGRGG